MNAFRNAVIYLSLLIAISSVSCGPNGSHSTADEGDSPTWQIGEAITLLEKADSAVNAGDFERAAIILEELAETPVILYPEADCVEDDLELFTVLFTGSFNSSLTNLIIKTRDYCNSLPTSDRELGLRLAEGLDGFARMVLWMEVLPGCRVSNQENRAFVSSYAMWITASRIKISILEESGESQELKKERKRFQAGERIVEKHIRPGFRSIADTYLESVNQLDAQLEDYSERGMEETEEYLLVMDEYSYVVGEMDSKTGEHLVNWFPRFSEAVGWEVPEMYRERVANEVSSIQ